MKTVQLSIRDAEYAQSLRNLLLRDGAHRVNLVDRPDLSLDGVVVIDDDRFGGFSVLKQEPERFVVITHKGTDSLSRIWDAGIRHVVFAEDSPNTAQLAVFAAELRLPKAGVPPRMNRAPVLHNEKHRSARYPTLPVLGSRLGCSRCGLKDANTYKS